jgi:hypothetical protein
VTRPGRLAAWLGGVVVATAATWGMAAPTATGGSPVEPGTSAGSSTYAAPRVLCTVTDERLPEISGAAGIPDGLLVANDKLAEVFTLDDGCSVSGATRWRGPATEDATPASDRDVEDLAVGPDGTVWLVDSGSNRISRDDVSLLGLEPDGTSTELVFTYPQGAARDVEAALVTQDLQLVLLTKERGTSTVLTARLPAPDPNADVTGPVELAAVGRLDVEAWADPALGEAALYLTGAALSPDGRHVAVRTAAEIFEWVVDGNDLAAELVDAEPTRVAFVEQRQGESITYTPDGSSLLALSEQLPSPVLVVDIERNGGSVGGGPVGVPRWGYGLLVGAAGALLLVLVVALWRVRTTSREPVPDLDHAPHHAPDQELVP